MEPLKENWKTALKGFLVGKMLSSQHTGFAVLQTGSSGIEKLWLATTDCDRQKFHQITFQDFLKVPLFSKHSLCAVSKMLLWNIFHQCIKRHLGSQGRCHSFINIPSCSLLNLKKCKGEGKCKIEQVYSPLCVPGWLTICSWDSFSRWKHCNSSQLQWWD